MTNPSQSQPMWSASEVAWKIDHGATRPSGRRWGYVVLAAYLASSILVIAFESDGWAQPRGPDLRYLVLAGALCAIAVFETAMIVRSNRRWQRLRAVLWESNGAACPWCAVRTDSQPCPGHGFTTKEHALLLRYWEALLGRRKDVEARALLELLEVAPRRPLFQRITGPVDRLRLRSLISRNDPELTTTQRFRAGIPYASVVAAATILAGTVVLAIFPFEDRRFVFWCGVLYLVATLLGILLPLTRQISPRCAKCGHLCATDRPDLCPECGANLRMPSAVRRVERSTNLILLRCGVGALACAAWYFSDALIDTLPSRVRLACFSTIGPSRDYWLDLDPTTMTQTEVDEAADLLIECVRRSASQDFPDFNFLNFAYHAGKLAPETAERAARVSVRATLSAEQDGDALVATVSPLFRAELHKTTRLVFGGVSVDGGPWTKPADWSIFLEEVTEHGRESLREVGDLEPLPEAQLTFTARVDGVAPGTCTVRARCWIVVYGDSWERYTPAFDEDGVLIPPAGVRGVYPLDLEATVDMR